MKNNFKLVNKIQGNLKVDNPYFTIAIAIIIGFLIFLINTNIAILNPTNFNWLMEGDPAQNYLGWQFFRNSPYFQWPLGLNPDSGAAISSSIVYSDSIPIFALLFKSIRFLLPETFQYVGIWILSCFILQYFFSVKLLQKISNDLLLPFIGALFFTIAPFALWRLTGHYSLFAQWVIIAALNLYFSKKYSNKMWAVLLSITALIHAYLLVMVLSLWFFDLVHRYIIKESTLKKVIYSFILCLSITILTMYSIGYFVVGSGVSTLNYGFFKMNLLSLVDPNNWSSILKDIPSLKGEYEGFNYLGIGVIILAIMSFRECLHYKKNTIVNKKIILLIVLSLILFLFSVSNNIAIGDKEIINLKLPKVFYSLFGSFRASGRFFWPVSYLIYLLVFYNIFKYMTRKSALIVCISLFVLQVVDTDNISKKFKNPLIYTSVLRSESWSEIAKNYDKLVYVLPYHRSKNWLELSDFAVQNGLSINTGYFARYDVNKLKNEREYLRSAIINDNIDQNSLYIIEDSGLWNILNLKYNNSKTLFIKDGFKVFAPGFQMIDSIGDYDLPEPLNPIELNKNVYINKENVNLLLGGWHSKEEWGIWGRGNRKSLLLIPLQSHKLKNYELVVDCQTFLYNDFSSQEVDVYINNRLDKTFYFTHSENRRERKILISKEFVKESEGKVIIGFVTKNPKSPMDVGLNVDKRNMGLGVYSIKLIDKID